MGQDEKAATPVACACFSRCEDARLCRVAHAAKAGFDVGVAHGQVPFHVFAEDPFWLDFAGDAGDFGPKVTRVALTSPAAGIAEGLAWIAGREEMNAAAPRATVEGSQVVPDKSFTQGLVRHPCHESGRGVGFPLDVTDSSILRLGDVQAEIEASISGAEGDTTEVVSFRFERGTKVHISAPFDRSGDRRARRLGAQVSPPIGGEGRNPPDLRTQWSAGSKDSDGAVGERVAFGDTLAGRLAAPPGTGWLTAQSRPAAPYVFPEGLLFRRPPGIAGRPRTARAG